MSLFSCFWPKKSVAPVKMEIPLQGLEAELENEVVRTVDAVKNIFTDQHFFDPLFCPEGTWEKMVIRNLNPEIKGYTDFNILLLRISDTIEDYIELSSFYHPDRLATIQNRIERFPVPDKMKRYYLENLNSFERCYFKHPHSWKNSTRVEQFIKLQKLARAGNIVATIGEIHDLNLLGHSKASVYTSQGLL